MKERDTERTVTSKKIFNIIQSQVYFDIRKKSRKTKYVEMRSIYYKIAHDIVGRYNDVEGIRKQTLSDIGKVVNKDHSSVLHGLKCFDVYSFGGAGEDFLKEYNKLKMIVNKKISKHIKQNKDILKDIREGFLIQRVIYLKEELKKLEDKNSLMEEELRARKIALSPLEKLVIDIPGDKQRVATDRIRAVVEML